MDRVRLFTPVEGTHYGPKRIGNTAQFRGGRPVVRLMATDEGYILSPKKGRYLTPLIREDKAGNFTLLLSKDDAAALHFAIEEVDEVTAHLRDVVSGYLLSGDPRGWSLFLAPEGEAPYQGWRLNDPETDESIVHKYR